MASVPIDKGSRLRQQRCIATRNVGRDTADFLVLDARKGGRIALAAGVEGVKKVINELLVIKPVEKKKGAVEGFVDDTVIDTKINGLLLDATGVNVTNFRWRSVQGHVFLFGRALSADEQKKAIAIVKGIKGVLSVTDRSKVRPKS